MEKSKLVADEADVANDQVNQEKDLVKKSTKN